MCIRDSVNSLHEETPKNKTYIQIYCKTLKRNLVFQVDSGADFCVLQKKTLGALSIDESTKSSYEGVIPGVEKQTYGTTPLEFALPVRSFTLKLHVSDLPQTWLDGLLGDPFLKGLNAIINYRKSMLDIEYFLSLIHI